MTDLVVQQKSELIPGIQGEMVKFEAQDAAWGAGASLQENKALFRDDIVVPKLRLQQRSALNYTGVQAGNYLDSMTGEVFGGQVQFIVFDMYKIWRTEHVYVDKNGKQKSDYVSSEMFTAENANYEYNFTLDGKTFKRKAGLYFSVLLLNHLQNGVIKPYTLDFFASSKNSGRELTTYMDNLAKAGAPSAAVVFGLEAEEKKFDDGIAHIKKVVPIGYASKEMVAAAKKAYLDLNAFGKEKIQIDESDVLNASDDIPF